MICLKWTWFRKAQIDIKLRNRRDSSNKILKVSFNCLSLIAWNISLTDWFSKGFVNFTNFTSFSLEFFSKWKQQLFTYAVRMGTLSVFYCLILSKLAQLSRSRQFLNSVMSDQNKNCQFALKRRAIWRKKYLIQRRNV